MTHYFCQDSQDIWTINDPKIAKSAYFTFNASRFSRVCQDIWYPNESDHPESSWFRKSKVTLNVRWDLLTQVRIMITYGYLRLDIDQNQIFLYFVSRFVRSRKSTNVCLFFSRIRDTSQKLSSEFLHRLTISADYINENLCSRIFC